MYLREVHAWSKQVLAAARDRPDHLVYSQGLAVWSGARELGPRLIVHPHGLEAYQAIGIRNRLVCVPFRLVFNRIFHHAARVVSLGGRLTGILNRHVRKPATTIVSIPNAVCVPAWVPRGLSGVTRLLFVGRFAENKGITDLLEAIRILNAKGHESRVHLDLVGDGPLRRRLEEECAFPNVAFHGSVPDDRLWTLYEQGHAVVLPTLYEGMPTVILEGMARGLPAITTDVGATSELVNPKTGLLVPARNSEALADALLHFAELPPATRTAMSQACRAHVEAHFTWPRVAQMHISLFEDLAQELRLDSAPG